VSLGFPPDNRPIFRRSQFQGFKNECARQRCDGLKEAMCATRVVFKGTGTIGLRGHRSRRQDREDRTRQMFSLTVSGQPREISLERLGQPMSLYVPLSKGTL
jgi:hypothetical protein